MKRSLLLLAFVSGSLTNAKAQYTTLFTQDFESSTAYTDYIGGANKFAYINTDNSATNTISITDGKLTFAKTDASSKASAGKSSLAATFIKASFDFSVSGNTSESGNAVIISYGNGFTSTTGNPGIGITHSRIFIAFQSVSGKFSVLPYESPALPVPTDPSLIFSGEQTISWFINNTGSAVTYPAPDGTNHNLADDSYDVWVGAGNTTATQKLIVNGHTAATGTVDLNSFKIGYVNSTGTIQLDNITVQSFTPLPVDLVSFTGENANDNIRLHWTTASELNNSHFEIERSADGKIFTTIGSLPGKGTTSTPGDYTFTDREPVQGINYYRLRQVDFNGMATESSIIAVRYTFQTDNLNVYVNNNQLTVRVQSPDAMPASLKVCDITGKRLLSAELNLQKGANAISLPADKLTNGILIGSLNIGGKVNVVKFRK
ncbi:hypothetical protein FW774_05355 (plasmid) [Pedobacter sp. BS3]|uniref:hypothetical protein n=1 Tax=Pedobacter sp. BS3 TaxID=2567937 RepID=UPI0011EC9780|nr:hypothetical protein [Pedobacter sp. BS3]TZF86469.1 hypothetical protein FW774_05355 [Pedobacter sp. BS3]